MDFDTLAQRVTDWLGSPVAIIGAFTVVGAWNIGGILFGFTDVWMLIINTVTTIVTFLMVFILQRTQNRDSKAVQAKLDELIEVSRAPNRLVGADEDLTEDDIRQIREQQAKESGQGD